MIEQVGVIQADHDAVGDLIAAISNDETLRRLHEGGLLPIPPVRLLLPAFARHRIASTLPSEREAIRAEAFEEAAKVAAATKAYDDLLQRSSGCATVGERIAASIRNLSSTPSGDAK